MIHHVQANGLGDRAGFHAGDRDHHEQYERRATAAAKKKKKNEQDVESARELVAALRRGEKPLPTRGAPLTDFKGISRQLAGFSQHGDERAAAAAIDAPGALGPTLVGLRLRRGARRVRARDAAAVGDVVVVRRRRGRGRRRRVREARRTRAGRTLAWPTRTTAPTHPAGTEPGTSGRGPGKA